MNKQEKANKSSSIINQINLSNKITINNNNEKKDDTKDVKDLDLNLISINLNNLSKVDNIPKESNITLYNYTMKEAFKYDRRNIIVIFYIYFLSKQAFFHAFLYRSPLVLFPLRFCLLLFILSSDLALNAFFYFNDNISRKYKNTKNIFIFTFSNNYTVILLSTLVGFILLTFFTNLSNTTKNIRDVFKKEEKKIRKNKNYKIDYSAKMRVFAKVENALKYYKIKLGFFLFFVLVLILGFCYFITAFCQVYPNTQTSLLINCLISILIRFVVELLLCLLFAKLYLVAAKVEYVCFFKFMLFVYDFILSYITVP